MKYIKKFNEGFFDFAKRGKNSFKKQDTPSRPRPDYSSINKNDNSIIPIMLFRPDVEIRNIVKQKISNLEQDSNFIDIMDMIKNGEIKKAKTDGEGTHFRIGKNAKFVLSDGRIISVNPVKTWELPNGDYDIYYIMSVDDSPLGYISSSNYNYILDELNKHLDF